MANFRISSAKLKYSFAEAQTSGWPPRGARHPALSGRQCAFHRFAVEAWVATGLRGGEVEVTGRGSDTPPSCKIGALLALMDKLLLQIGHPLHVTRTGARSEQGSFGRSPVLFLLAC